MTSQFSRVVDEGVPDTIQLLRELMEVRRRMSQRAQPTLQQQRRASIAPPQPTP